MVGTKYVANAIRGIAHVLAVCIMASPLGAQTPDGMVARVTALETQLERMERLLEISAQPWEPVAPNIRGFHEWISKDFDRLRTYEFGIERNSGFRRLTVSDWNGGFRFMTDFYWRGDHPTKNPFGLGGSVWIVGTNDPKEVECKGNEVWHYYYMFNNGKVELNSGNGCRTEGTVYARKRLFRGDLE